MRRQIKLGVPVRMQDGSAGRLSQIVLDPAGWRPVLLIVRPGHIRPGSVAVPVDRVKDLSAEQLILELTAKEMASLPGYSAEHGTKNEDRRVAVVRKMRLIDASGLHVGRVSGLVVDDDDRQGSHLLVEHGEPHFTRRRAVPTNLISKVTSDELWLNINADHFYGLAIYRAVPEW
jgi:sporulation protein YlmC with PRC-barrel domain